MQFAAFAQTRLRFNPALPFLSAQRMMRHLLEATMQVISGSLMKRLIDKNSLDS
jgi:hypothetical protein